MRPLEFPWTEADTMYLLLVRRAADLRNCSPGSPEEEEFDCVSNTIAAYEAKRWVESVPPSPSVSVQVRQ
jgi:hypothetical protein